MTTRRQIVRGTGGAIVAAAAFRTSIPAFAQGTPEASPAASPVVLDIDIASLPLRKPGVLTVHADQPLYEPWFVDNDPTNGKGFESAITYAIANTLGFTNEQLEWGYTSFNTSYAPGPKDFDFYITEVSITPERAEVVDFSDPYYQSPLVLVTKADSPILAATTIAELKEYKWGTQVGTTYATYIDEVIQPNDEMLVYDTNQDSLTALENGTVDAVLQSLQIGIFNVTIQYTDMALGGILPGSTADLGLVFEKGSELVPVVNQAIAAIIESGLHAQLVEEWLPIPPGLQTYAE
jgi:polar amino acid transport system substrate-binding protein